MRSPSVSPSPPTPAVVVWPVSLLVPYEKNPRKNDSAVDRMCASIEEFGFKIPCLVRGDGEVVDGHLRLKAANKLGITEVPVILCDEWSEAQVKAFRIMVNRSVAWANWDDELLAQELRDIEDSDMDIALTGFDSKEIDDLLASLEEDEPSDEVPLPPAVPTSRTGDLWLCGPHRVLCGDSTNAADVARLLGGSEPFLMVTDPIWQELVDQHGFAGSYESVKRFFRKQVGSQVPEARAVIVTAPGEEAQVDYGTGPLVRDSHTGKYRRTRLFVFTLGFSRKCIRLLSFQSSSRIWGELHETAFRRMGGTPKVIVLDNLREGVLQPDVYDPAINPLFRDLLAHYGCVAMPCRIRDPDRKGKVKSSVGHAQKTPLKGQRFENLAEAQAYLDRWEERWADTRIHGTTKRQVAAMFAEEKPALQPLPIEPFRYYQYGERTVHLDGCVEVEAAYYSAPPGWIGRRVRVQWDGVHVRLLDPRTGQLLREHLRQERGRHRIQEQDRAKRTPLGIVALLARASQTGENIGTFCTALYERQGEPAVRLLQGILSFHKKYGVARVDEACAAALELEAYDFRFVRRYLEHRSEPPVSLRQVDPLIRQLTLYRDLIEERTKGINE